ncbi:hypothetical protein [Thiocystis violacea]|uniref:hypothetical protein n=1 Tax=Thiocystis violacea TaxID=13725 RepID=UPI00190321D6|nr:hypothetical protein [Thiocystis violacea]MBK1720445.1 hypothetical protein [Thiocystis violacea]
MLKTLAIVSTLSGLIPILIIGVVFAGQGDWEQLLSLAGVFTLAGVGLFVMLLLVMLVFFSNRLRTRYTLNAQGILQETIDKVSKTANRLAVVAGVLGRSPGTAGAGLIAMNQEAEGLEWQGRFTLEARPRRHLLIFRNAWRPVLEVYCTADNFDQVQTLARHYMAEHGTRQRAEVKSPLPVYLLHTLLILLACVPIIAIHDEFNLDILLPMILLAFALATLWLIPLFGYVVLLTNTLILLSFTRAMLEEQTSYFRSGETYLHYQVFSDADWVNLGIALLALAYLSWLSLRAVRGKLMSLLIRDRMDMGA